GIAVVVLHRVLMRAIPTVLLILCFLVPLNLVRGLLKAAAYDPRDFDSKPLAARLPQPRRTPRLVWVIFDEWDARLTFRDRIPSLQMPALDRFEAISLHAGNAYPPSSQTGMSLPALTTGLLVRDAKPQGPDDLLLLRPEPNPSLHWHAVLTIFSEARAAGYNVAVAGFYHPYCRMFNGSLSECSWWPTALQYNSNGATFAEVVPHQIRSIFETDSRSLFGQALGVREHGHIQQQGMAAAQRLVRDPDLGVVFIHLPVPHPPFAYDRKTGRFDSPSPYNGYWDNLALLDRVVGQLRSAMEAANLWDSTNVLLSADHWNRASVLLDGKIDHRIPFLLKLAHQNQGVAFDQPFNTVLSHDFVTAILHGEVTTTQAAADWIERHRTIADSPYSTDFIP
ncbi:MAG TPA: sulfatase-like hydrolase/transferase, partial [Bryobacteraceae bacterium]